MMFFDSMMYTYINVLCYVVLSNPALPPIVNKSLVIMNIQNVATYIVIILMYVKSNGFYICTYIASCCYYIELHS